MFDCIGILKTVKSWMYIIDVNNHRGEYKICIIVQTTELILKVGINLL